MKDRDNFTILNFMKKTDSDLTGEVIHRINVHVYNMWQGVKYPKTPVTISQLTLIGLNNFTYYSKSIRIHWIHHEDL